MLATATYMKDYGSAIDTPLWVRVSANLLKRNETKELERKSEDDENDFEATTSDTNFESMPNDEIDIDCNEIMNISDIELHTTLSPIQKYPDDKSPSDIWILPSGKSVQDIIRGQKDLHKSQ
ncbi:593_t:CDS:2 [Entrophospora sp. SA101]|nr:593_t:CDS:2 [Entrophospora sp. SA101]CAJ0823063.1 10538_t:CDS:2 [Entrophospora sp. SA101]